MTGAAQWNRLRHRGGVRIEYIIAAIVCVALLIAMTAVLLAVSHRNAKLQLVRRPTASDTTTQQPGQPGTPTAPAPAPTPTPAPAPTPAPNPAPVAGGQGQQPEAVEVKVEEVPQPAPGATPDTPVVVIETPGQAAPATTSRGAYPAGKPWAIAANAPTRIQAEDFDTGGEGVAYHDVTPQNEGTQYRPGEGVDIEACNDTESKYAVGFVRPGEWMEYTLNVEQSGTYVVRLRAARGAGGDGKARLLFGGVDATGEIAVPSTGGWQTFASVERDNVELTAGQQVMRFEAITGDTNLNWIEIIPAAAYASIVIATDPLDTLKVGSRPAGGDWDFGTAGGTVSIQQSPQETSRCLRLLDNSPKASVWAMRKFASQTQQVGFECRVRFGQVADGYALGLLSGDKPAVLLLTKGGELGCEVGNGEWHALQRYDANTWYTVRIAADVKGQTFNVHVDGVQRGDKLKFRNGLQSVDAWQIETSAKATGTLYVNSMKVTER